jgi:hypothetical protein
MSYLDDLAEEIRSRVPDAAVPEDDDAEKLFRGYAVLLLAKGTNVTREDVHNAWAAWMLNKEEAHESIVPFDALGADVQREDSPFVTAIREAAALLGRPSV